MAAAMSIELVTARRRPALRGRARRIVWPRAKRRALARDPAPRSASSRSCSSRSCTRRCDRRSASTTGGRSLYAYVAVGGRARRRPGADPRRARPARAVPAAGGALHRRDGDLPDLLRPLHRLHRLEPELASTGRHFNGLDNLVDAVPRPLLLERAAQHGLLRGRACWCNTPSPSASRCSSTPTSAARKFFRVAFLLPFMLSPVAVSWMIGKSIMEYRFGPAATLARHLGWESPAFFASPWIAAPQHRWRWTPGSGFPSS